MVREGVGDVVAVEVEVMVVGAVTGCGRGRGLKRGLLRRRDLFAFVDANVGTVVRAVVGGRSRSGSRLRGWDHMTTICE
jgi:hypothetical protein